MLLSSIPAVLPNILTPQPRFSHVKHGQCLHVQSSCINGNSQCLSTPQFLHLELGQQLIAPDSKLEINWEASPWLFCLFPLCLEESAQVNKKTIKNQPPSHFLTLGAGVKIVSDCLGNYPGCQKCYHIRSYTRCLTILKLSPQWLKSCCTIYIA